MRVLFVCEGDHDAGKSDPLNWSGDRPAGGVVPLLCAKVCPVIDLPASRSLPAKHPYLLPGERTRRNFSRSALLARHGLDVKAARAVVFADRSGFAGTVMIVDADSAPATAIADMEAGAKTGTDSLGRPHGFVGGLAVQSIEAWTLGAPTALAACLKSDANGLRRHYSVADVEEFANTRQPHQNGKAILKRLCSGCRGEDGTEFREEVARATDPAELERYCPEGFGRLAKVLRERLCPSPRGDGAAEPMEPD